jgi:hypothetical protein
VGGSKKGSRAQSPARGAPAGTSAAGAGGSARGTSPARALRVSGGGEGSAAGAAGASLSPLSGGIAGSGFARTSFPSEPADRVGGGGAAAATGTSPPAAIGDDKAPSAWVKIGALWRRKAGGGDRGRPPLPAAAGPRGGELEGSSDEEDDMDLQVSTSRPAQLDPDE